MEINKSQTSIARARNAGRWTGKGRDWATPQELFDQLNNEFHFTIDVCASDWNAKCNKYFSEKDDALLQSWTGVCWMNPPYGKVLKNWMKKAYESSILGATVVCLVPAATDTDWWHDFAVKGNIRFLRGRPRFITPEGTWQQTFSPSVIVIFQHGKQQEEKE